MPDEKPLLISVIIPTRERGECLSESLKTAMAIRSKNVEIIIQDNCSTDQTQSIAIEAAKRDSRIRYHRQETRVSMRQNFESGVENSRGDYLMFIGDDDAILPGQFTKLEAIIRTYRPDCLSWESLRYTWPGLKGKTGSVTFRAHKIYGKLLPLQAKQLAKDLHGGLLNERMPSIYHGCAARTLLDKIKKRQGLIFAGSAPDVFFSYAAILTEGLNTLYIQHPFTISGIGPKSNGNAFNVKNRSSIDGSVNQNGAMFIDEISHDDVKDAIPNLMADSQYVQPVFFNIYETAKRFTNTSHEKTDYLQWYANVLSSLPCEAKKITYQALLDHAKKTNSVDQLDEAHACNSHKTNANIINRNINKLFHKASSIKFRFQVKTEIKGYKNTIYTAALWADLILGSATSESLRAKGECLSNQKINWLKGLIRKYRYRSNSHKIKLLALDIHLAPR